VRRLASLLLLATCAGCSSAASGPEILSWHLADGRDCLTAGVVAVESRTSASLDTAPIASARCADGYSPATFTLTDAPGSGTLHLDAVDSLGVALYQGELALDAAPPGTGEIRYVTLFAAAAQ
jgi:hypothetical protein